MKNLIGLLALMMLPFLTGFVTSQTITRYPDGREVIEKKGLFTPSSDRYVQILGAYDCVGCYSHDGHSYLPYDYYYGRRASLGERVIAVVAAEVLREMIYRSYGYDSYSYGRNYYSYGRRYPRHVEAYLDYESRFDTHGRVLPSNVRRTVYTPDGSALRNYTGRWVDVAPRRHR